MYRKGVGGWVCGFTVISRHKCEEQLRVRVDRLVQIGATSSTSLSGV